MQPQLTLSHFEIVFLPVQVEQYNPVELTEQDKKAQNLLQQAEKLEEAALSLHCAGSQERQSKMKRAVELYSQVRKLSEKVAKAHGL
jgi:hypothetical protein